MASANDTETRVLGLLELTERLSEIVDAENLALAERRRADVEAMLEEKATLSRLFENRLKALTTKEIDLNAASEELREQLREAGKRLEEATAENTVRLEVAMTANRKVIDAVANAIKQVSPHSGTYARSGRTGSEGSRASSNTVAFALDQTL